MARASTNAQASGRFGLSHARSDLDQLCAEIGRVHDSRQLVQVARTLEEATAQGGFPVRKGRLMTSSSTYPAGRHNVTELASFRSFSFRRLITRLLALTAVAAGLAAVSPAIALAAPCNGSSCVHGDPSAGCSNDAKSLETVTAPGGSASVTLRYSPACVANWAKLSSQTSGWNFFVQTYYDGHIETQIGPAYYFTYMVDGRQPARACIHGYATTAYACTRWL